MTQDDMREFARQMFDLYERKSYAEAYDLVTGQADRFPEWARRIYFWRACLGTRMGDNDQALDLLEEAMAQGHWFWTTGLREDSDLTPLQGLPRFEQIVADSTQLQESAKQNAPPAEMIVMEPDDAPSRVQLLIALHGNYSTAHDSVEYWRPATTFGWVVALPQSSQIDGPEGRVWNERDWTMSELKEHYSSLTGKYEVDASRTVLAGFSMGGWWAIWLCLAQSLPTRGFIAVSPFIPGAEQLAPLVQSRRDRPTCGYVIVGEQDPGGLKGAKAVAGLLREHDMACELEIQSELGHAYPEDFAAKLERALDCIVAH